MPTALRALAACAILPQLAFVRAGDAVGREGSWWHPTAVRNWCDELLAHPLAASCWCGPNRTDVLATGSRYPKRMEHAGQRAGEHLAAVAEAEGASLDEQLQPPPPLSPEVLWRMRDWGFNVHEVRALRAGVHSTR